MKLVVGEWIKILKDDTIAEVGKLFTSEPVLVPCLTTSLLETQPANKLGSWAASSELGPWHRLAAGQSA